MKVMDPKEIHKLGHVDTATCAPTCAPTIQFIDLLNESKCTSRESNPDPEGYRGLPESTFERIKQVSPEVWVGCHVDLGLLRNTDVDNLRAQVGTNRVPLRGQP